MRNPQAWIDDPTSFGLCSVDPISAAVGGLVAGVGGLLGSKAGGGGATPAPTPEQAPPPPPQQSPQGQAKKSQQSSFIGSVPTQPGASSLGGSKTLLGQ